MSLALIFSFPSFYTSFFFPLSLHVSFYISIYFPSSCSLLSFCLLPFPLYFPLLFHFLFLFLFFFSVIFSLFFFFGFYNSFFTTVYFPFVSLLPFSLFFVPINSSLFSFVSLSFFLNLHFCSLPLASLPFLVLLLSSIPSCFLSSLFFHFLFWVISVFIILRAQKFSLSLSAYYHLSGRSLITEPTSWDPPLGCSPPPSSWHGCCLPPQPPCALPPHHLVSVLLAFLPSHCVPLLSMNTLLSLQLLNSLSLLTY